MNFGFRDSRYHEYLFSRATCVVCAVRDDSGLACARARPPLRRWSWIFAYSHINSVIFLFSLLQVVAFFFRQFIEIQSSFSVFRLSWDVAMLFFTRAPKTRQWKRYVQSIYILIHDITRTRCKIYIQVYITRALIWCAWKCVCACDLVVSKIVVAVGRHQRGQSRRDVDHPRKKACPREREKDFSPVHTVK